MAILLKPLISSKYSNIFIKEDYRISGLIIVRRTEFFF
jgi:hypothetical protein